MTRAREGYICIDHSNSPGIPEGFFEKCGLRVDPAVAALFGEGRKAEFATLSCSHCDNQIIRNPGRTRERGKCFQCFRYLCDVCAAEYKVSGCCKSLARQFDLELERAIRRQESTKQLMSVLKENTHV